MEVRGQRVAMMWTIKSKTSLRSLHKTCIRKTPRKDKHKALFQLPIILQPRFVLLPASQARNMKVWIVWRFEERSHQWEGEGKGVEALGITAS